VTTKALVEIGKVRLLLIKGVPHDVKWHPSGYEVNQPFHGETIIRMSHAKGLGHLRAAIKRAYS
jgi:hypothetical protein